MSVITFQDYLPLPREDGIPWTKIRIEESEFEVGPWVFVEEQTFDDPDEDPSQPKPRDFTTTLGTLDPGWYRVTFLDADSQMLETEPIPYPDVPEADNEYVPTVTEVAEHIRARTKDQHGNEIGTFDGTTRPNAQDVVGLIRKATSDVAAAVDYDIPEEAQEQVRDLISLGAAMRVELSYWPEQVGTNRSPYDQLKELYDDGLERLIESVLRERSEAGEVVVSALTPVHYFPEDRGGLIGWGTRW